jgi:hypothetical protein
MFTLSATCKKQGQAPFDSSSVDSMRRLLEHAGVPGHIYPLSLLCYEIMPPPQQVPLRHYFISAHHTTLDIYFCVVPVWTFLLSFNWIGRERDWWAKGDILPWSRLISNWRNKVCGYYCSYQECWWGLFSVIFICTIMLLDSADTPAPATNSVW